MSVENALYADPYVSEAAAVGVPHPRLGELVAAVVSVRPENKDRVTEKALIVLAEKRCVAVSICFRLIASNFFLGYPNLLYQ